MIKYRDSKRGQRLFNVVCDTLACERESNSLGVFGRDEIGLEEFVQREKWLVVKDPTIAHNRHYCPDHRKPFDKIAAKINKIISLMQSISTRHHVDGHWETMRARLHEILTEE